MDRERQVVQAVGDRATDGQISCAKAHQIAAELGVEPLAVGAAVNRGADVRFGRCQLGLFGYGSKAEGKSKIVLAAKHVPAEIEQAILQQVRSGRISCTAAWQIADQFEYPRLGLANILEAMGIKVSPCQLGCF